jgi:hypothetical protein
MFVILIKLHSLPCPCRYMTIELSTPSSENTNTLQQVSRPQNPSNTRTPS